MMDGRHTYLTVRLLVSEGKAIPTGSGICFSMDKEEDFPPAMRIVSRIFDLDPNCYYCRLH